MKEQDDFKTVIGSIDVPELGFKILQYQKCGGGVAQLCLNSEGQIETQFGRYGTFIPARTDFNAEKELVLIIHALNGCKQNIQNPRTGDHYPAITVRDGAIEVVSFIETYSQHSYNIVNVSRPKNYSIGQDVLRSDGKMYAPSVATFTRETITGKIISAEREDNSLVEGIHLEDLNKSAQIHFKAFGELRNVAKIIIKPVLFHFEDFSDNSKDLTLSRGERPSDTIKRFLEQRYDLGPSRHIYRSYHGQKIDNHPT